MYSGLLQSNTRWSRGKELRLLSGHLGDERSQWCNRLLRTNGPVAGFAFGERESEQGKEVMRRGLLKRNLRGKGQDACL
jgi:hypothetical protein